MENNTVYELGFITDDGFFGFYGLDFESIEDAKKYAADVPANIHLCGIYAENDLGIEEIERF